MSSPLHPPPNTSSRGVADGQRNDEDSISTQERGNETISNIDTRMDATDAVAVEGGLQVEGHLLQPKATRHLFLPVPRLLATGKAETLAPNDEKTSQNKSNDKANAPNRAPGIGKSIVTTSFPHPFTDLRRNADKKVVGLKDYGISKSMKDVRKHEWISSGSLSHSNLVSANFNERTDQGGIPDGIPSIPSSDRKEPPQGLTNHDVSKAPDASYPVNKSSVSTGPPGATKRKSVEELEFKARQKAIMNPFRLLFSGNIAALKVMGFYLITLETFITCGLVSSRNVTLCTASMQLSAWDLLTHGVCSTADCRPYIVLVQYVLRRPQLEWGWYELCAPGFCSDDSH
jgi:hypothetical protein